MPINLRTSKNGFKYYQYGDTGKKYYFNPASKESQDLAYKKALKQTWAINARRQHGILIRK